MIKNYLELSKFEEDRFIQFINRNKKESCRISLIVITKNSIAFDMYKKRGFKEIELISEWFQLN